MLKGLEDENSSGNGFRFQNENQNNPDNNNKTRSIKSKNFKFWLLVISKELRKSRIITIGFALAITCLFCAGFIEIYLRFILVQDKLNVLSSSKRNAKVNKPKNTTASTTESTLASVEPFSSRSDLDNSDTGEIKAIPHKHVTVKFSKKKLRLKKLKDALKRYEPASASDKGNKNIIIDDSEINSQESEVRTGVDFEHNVSTGNVISNNDNDSKPELKEPETKDSESVITSSDQISGNGNIILNQPQTDTNPQNQLINLDITKRPKIKGNPSQCQNRSTVNPGKPINHDPSIKISNYNENDVTPKPIYSIKYLEKSSDSPSSTLRLDGFKV